MKHRRVAVILGGHSKEREVSLRTGAAVLKALLDMGYDAIPFDPQTDDLGALRGSEAAFIALHGRFGEDGCIQGLLETLQIPYTGSGILSSALCYHKILTKLLVKDEGVLTPDSVTFDSEKEDLETFFEQRQMGLPLIVKPSREGSTLGMSLIKTAGDLKPAMLAALKFDTMILIEQYIVGTEVTVGVLDGRALPVVEIVPKSGFYDYTAKYTPGHTEYFVPARLHQQAIDELVRVSEKIVQLLGCRGAPRLDFIVDKEGRPFFLEVNTIPGMTETSLLPKAARGIGISFNELCERILKTATLDHRV